jgi:2-polyprenyl-3-methyl-5-hydroxy-6-metoxy-1,4-benzoquinol methylase
MPNDAYHSEYYLNNSQNKDRPALVWYARLTRLYFREEGPILDFGAGTGHLTKRLRVPSMAIETNSFAKTQLSKNAPNSKQITFDELKKIEREFAGIVALHVVEHLTDEVLNSTLQLFSKSISKNGSILISTPALNGLAHKIKGEHWLALSDPTHINIKESAEWVKLFKNHGFEVTRQFSDGYYDFPYGGRHNLRNFRFGIITAINIVLRHPYLKIDSGENNVFILKLKKHD